MGRSHEPNHPEPGTGNSTTPTRTTETKADNTETRLPLEDISKDLKSRKSGNLYLPTRGLAEAENGRSHGR